MKEKTAKSYVFLCSETGANKVTDLLYLNYITHNLKVTDLNPGLRLNYLGKGLKNELLRCN